MRSSPRSSDGSRRAHCQWNNCCSIPILIYEPSLTFSQGNCTETTRIRPTKPPLRPARSPDYPPTNREQILASTYKIPSLIFLRNLPSLCSAATRYFSISPLQRFPSLCSPPIGLSRLYSIPRRHSSVFPNSLREELLHGPIHT